MLKYTEHFTEEQLIKSETAKRLKINNTPTAKVRGFLILLCKNCLEIIREHYNKPVIITSGYRSPELNKAIGGVSTSQHSKGQAADFIIRGISIAEIVGWCRNNLVFDQLINEKNQWVHISYNPECNRKQVLFFNGKTYLRI